MKVLVCGGRDFNQREFLFKKLDEIHSEKNISMIIHGCARGADTMAKEWADKRQIPHLGFPADWKSFRNAAGPIRNSLMLSEGRPDLVVSFPGGTGTADMVKKTRKAGVPVIEVKYD